MKTYATETSKEIHNLRLKDRIGPKPNANSHITISHWDHRDCEVMYIIGEKNERDRKLPKDI